ncbi:cytochrome b-c1 complex subunit 9, mitochondrial [[Candida] railenensis]|uniref:Complex III subunit 9 n=1 Tax=[Candida] railenensis TaxID=45579 RepID=A0A9P0VZN0_9ASCO|nr:cytochrome b-c1 complex subunit 9, mitochondrial [[Candida] railenensis]
MSFIASLFQRNSIYVATIFGGAFAFQGFFDVAVTKWYENHNKGKLWHDVKGKFLDGGDEDEDDE